MQSASIPKERVLEKLDSLLANNDYTKAKSHLIYWLTEAEAINDDRSTLLFQNELMGLCRKLSEKDEAIAYANKALAQVSKMNIADNIGAATTYLNCATVFKAFSMADKALPLYERARSIYEKELSCTDERFGGLYNNTALALVDLGRFREANELYKKALSVMESNEGCEPEQAITYLNMASAVEAELGLEKGEAQISAFCEKATELLEKCKDQKDGNYAFVCEKCACVFGYYGYYFYEKQLIERYRRIYEGT